MDLTGRERAQNRTLARQPARAWGGADQLASIAAQACVEELAVCPSCSIVSRLLHLSTQDSIAAIAHEIIPSMAPGNTLRKARCVLCAAAEFPAVRNQEAATGHIWFLIGDPLDGAPPQSALNQHWWGAISNASPRTRAAARRQLLEMAASRAFGTLRLPHLQISAEERAWLIDQLHRSLGDDSSALLGEETIQAFTDQWGVTLLLEQRKPAPQWSSHVRFVPTPSGVEAYRQLLLLPEAIAPDRPGHRRGGSR